MDVSVIIPTRNTAALTAEAVRAVLAGDRAVNVEVIVVDNGSTDETATALLREFPQIKLLRAGQNLGFARACNLAARSAAGEFLLLLNSDARPEPDALLHAVQWLRAHPDCAVAGAQLLNAEGSRQNSIANFPTLATELLNKSLLRRLWPKKFPGKEQIFTAPIEVETVVGVFVFARKSIWVEFGGLDERFFFFFEETDFCLQVRKKSPRYALAAGPRPARPRPDGQTSFRRRTHRILAFALPLLRQTFWRGDAARAARRNAVAIAGGLAGGGVDVRAHSRNKSALALAAASLLRAGRLAFARMHGGRGPAPVK